MAELSDLLLAFVVLATTLHVGTALVAALRCGLDQAPALPTDPPPVTILRPVCGLDDHDALTLGSTFTLDYPAYDIIFCAAQADDPGARLAATLIARNPHIPARLLVGDERISPNPKLNNLVKAWHAETAAWVVMADSNVLMPRDYLQRLFAAWTPGRTGLVCSPPVGCLAETFMAEVEAGFLNTYQARWQLAADATGFGFAQGKSMLWRRDILDRAGGIGALAAELAEDAAATKVVRAAGLSVRLSARPFEQPLGRRTARQVWDRQLRWARLRYMTFPIAFAPEVLSGALPPLAALALWAQLSNVTAGPLWSLLLAFAVLWYGTEALLARAARWPLTWRSPAAWLARDALLPLVWAGAVYGPKLSWRGTTLCDPHGAEAGR